MSRDQSAGQGLRSVVDRTRHQSVRSRPRRCSLDMELSRVTLSSLLIVLAVVYCSAETSRCDTNERSNPTSACKVTCNACRDCGPCICKSGYIRLSPKGECISEEDCHNLHYTWMHDAKHSNKKDKFFNCGV